LLGEGPVGKLNITENIGRTGFAAN